MKHLFANVNHNHGHCLLFISFFTIVPWHRPKQNLAIGFKEQAGYSTIERIPMPRVVTE